MTANDKGNAISVAPITTTPAVGDSTRGPAYVASITITDERKEDITIIVYPAAVANEPLFGSDIIDNLTFARKTYVDQNGTHIKLYSKITDRTIYIAGGALMSTEREFWCAIFAFFQIDWKLGVSCWLFCFCLIQASSNRCWYGSTSSTSFIWCD